jgi:DNA-binding transcriptional LysR family regulator
MDRYIALQVFRHVAELNSFAEAGRRLSLSPAAISKNIAELEAHVGARLINRTTRRMALTEEGRIYLDYVVRGLDAFSEADKALCPIKTGPSGILRVSAPMTVTLTRLSTAIPRFLSRYVNSDLKLIRFFREQRFKTDTPPLPSFVRAPAVLEGGRSPTGRTAAARGAHTYSSRAA